MKRYVLKFGGSSVKSIDKMMLVAKRIIDILDDETQLVVVVSAMGKTTNNLYNLARKITASPNKRDLDLLLSTGEVVSITLLSIILNHLGYKSICLTGEQAKINTIGEYQNSKIDNINTDIILKHLNEGRIVIVAGYQGVNLAGEITTLGREGSDTSAVNLAYYLNCPCMIFTDVDGVYEIDPRILNDSKIHKSLSYKDMLALSTNGAKVIANSAIEFAKEKEVLIYLASTFNKDSIGTKIHKNAKELNFVGIVGLENIRIIKIKDENYSDIFSIFNNYGLKYDVISEDLIALASDDVVLLNEVITNNIKYSFEELFIDNQLIKVSLIGSIFNNNKLINELITLLNEKMINIILTKHKESRFSIFINKGDYLNCVKILYCFIENI